MEFKRLNPAGRTFAGDAFKIRRPSGPKLSRAGLALLAKSCDYDVRSAGEEIWLMDGDRLVGYAVGSANEWHLVIDERPFEMNQPELGKNRSHLESNVGRVGGITGSGFPLRVAKLETSFSFTHEQMAFVVMIALLGWRESDRSLFSPAGIDPGSLPAGA